MAKDPSSNESESSPRSRHAHDIQEGEIADVTPDDTPAPPSAHDNTLPVSSDSAVKIGGEDYANQGVQPEDVREAVDEAKKDFITIFGLFAALLIFLSVEVQVFQQAKRFSYVMGVSFFMLSAILSFALTIHSLFNSEVSSSRYKTVIILAILFFIASAACFLWGIEHTLAFWHWHLLGNPSTY